MKFFSVLIRGFNNRLRELVLSVYLYNEWRGYTQLRERFIPLLEKSGLADSSFLAGVQKHASDEQKHYELFKSYFYGIEKLPFQVGRSIGYFDLLCRCLVRERESTELDNKTLAEICRTVVTTERRGIHQVAAMLRWKLIQQDPVLQNVFRVIRSDEPSHITPYATWLRKHGLQAEGLWAGFWDRFIHYGIATIVIPILFLNFRLRRMSTFPA